jgi:acyl-[acyl-carrier-protein]-phospholipid O-acyltransferase/long-chain-fatty-acid--[acyl-carrier-protein] ligase
MPRLADEHLLLSRRFLPLFMTQTLGALNDNFFKNALIVQVIFHAVQGGGVLVAVAQGLFILPYALFSSIAGQLADAGEKSRLIRWTKLLELALMALAAAGFATGNQALLLAVLFGLGVQSTFFSPIKYAILPDHLCEAELVRGNALIEAGTFGGILAGTIAGGALIGLDHGPTIVAVAGLLVAAFGLAASLLIPRAKPAMPGLRVGWNIPAETLGILRDAKRNRPVWQAILGLSWFWTIGVVFISEFPVLAAQQWGAGNQTVTLMLACFAIGVGAGSMLVGRLLDGEISVRHVPFAALGITLFGGGFAWAVAPVDAHSGWTSIAGILLHPRGVGAMACLIGTAVSGGVFSVPLFTTIQACAAPGERSRFFAANSVLNAAFMVAGAGALAALSSLGVSPAAIIGSAVAVNFAVAVRICLLRKRDVLRGIMRAYFSTLHGVTVTGLPNFRAAGERVVICVNHQSYMDAALAAAFLPGDITFAVDTSIAKRWWARPFLAFVDVFTVDPLKPMAIRDMVRLVIGGRKLMIFPEGRITRTGGLMKIYDGAGLIAERAGAKILIVRIDGPDHSRLSHMGEKQLVRWFPRLSVHIMPPAPLSADPDLQGRARRQALAAELEDRMILAQQGTRPVQKTLFAALLDSRARYGGGTPIIEDSAFAPLSLNRLVVAACVLGRAIASDSRAGECLGVMLPNANGAVVTFFAVQAFGRVPAMLNFTAGAEAMLAACAAAQVRTVLSSRSFVERAKLQTVVDRMAPHVRILWLEDVRQNLGRSDKLRGLWDAWRARRLPGARGGGEGTGVVLFTSGSEGAPKAVALSHRNILSNIAQIGAVVDFSPADRVLCAMPMFHSFGLTGATLLPIFAGVKTFLYPSPLHYRVVPELAYGTDATITFGTDTFLAGWARYANPYDFRTMRMIFAGGEKLREETRRLYADRFGVRLLEGYGVTETGPVLAVNTPKHNRPGSVGRLLPGIEARIVPVPGIEQGGRLWVRGPNIMLGYLRAGAPEPLPDGWYDTGDIVTLSPERFVTIAGRAKRFAKIGGEMVSLAAAELLAQSLWPSFAHAVIARPDPRKGQALHLVTTNPDAGIPGLLGEARRRGMSELMVPRALHVIENMPMLGTGKIDIPAVERMIEISTEPAAQELVD